MRANGGEEPTSPRLNECPSCLRWGVHTPVETWRRTPMQHCTFHHWLMKGREHFLLYSYVKDSEYFGFVSSLPLPDDMMRMNLAPERGIAEIGDLILSEKRSRPEGRPPFLPLRSAASSPGRVSGPLSADSRAFHSATRQTFARETPPPACDPARCAPPLLIQVRGAGEPP